MSHQSGGALVRDCQMVEKEAKKQPKKQQQQQQQKKGKG
jgi:hypothetical protein